MKQPTAQQVVEFRVESGLTQTAFAKLVHVSDRQVQYWESAQFKMPVGLWELAHLKLGVKLP